MFMNIFFSHLGLARLSNKFKTKAQVYFVYKQTNINELFVEPSPNYLRTT